MKNRTTQIIYGYWNEVRQNRLAPRRFDIEPARIAGILAETMILELAEADTIRFRLAGTRMTEWFGTELRGQSFLDLWPEENRHSLRHQLETMKQHGGALLIEFEATTPSGRTIDLEAIMLPLIHTRDVVDRFLGTVSTLTSPMWLGAEPFSSMRITSADIVWPDGRPFALAERHGQPPALAANSAAGRIVRFERRQFRVLDGGRKVEG